MSRAIYQSLFFLFPDPLNVHVRWYVLAEECQLINIFKHAQYA